MTRPQLSAFSKSLMRSYNSSRAGTRAAEKVNINQSPTLQLHTPAQRTGQPLKAAAWRE